ncbi:MAG: MFS transporter, partial [Thermomicrobiales bacterium]
FGNITTTIFAVMIASSFGLIYLGHASLSSLLIGILVLDIGVAGLQITNQSYIYQLAADARSRITATYMTAYFVGGATGSAVASVVYEDAGWAGVCVVGALLGVGIITAHLVSQIRIARSPVAEASGRG